MKVCVTSQGGGPDAAVDPRFGRAAFFVVHDPDTGELHVIENAGPSSGGGAGISAAKQVIDAGAGAVLTGNCGPNAFRTLRAGNAQVYTGVGGTVREALEAFEAGKLTPDSQASVDSHAGME